MAGPPSSPRRRKLVTGIVTALVAAIAIAGCSTSSDGVSPLPDSTRSDAPLTLRRRFPSDGHPGVRTRGCTFASPLAVDDGGARRILVADGGGVVTAIDPVTGDAAWSVTLPAPDGE